MVEFAREAFEGDEIDMDYEFDAPKYMKLYLVVMFYVHVSTRLEFSNHMAQDTPKTKLKSPGKSPHLSRSSTLMKPTASQLAKQNQHREVHSDRLLRRCYYFSLMFLLSSMYLSF
ncbi:hypothetical protein DVH24_022685 [Malus domestica]|uniref:Uncharacterized protein n=1 Tax=Malus domestica TaxID=3750 RepID=A0A498KN30_MALDO|nr:hypothetical protein DVH24_022685 [Malus domestica]